MPSSIPIALIDDHELFRSALCDMIERLGGYDVVVQAGNGKEYQEAIADGTRVAVAIVDLHMPVMDGFETISWIRADHPETRALALTFDKDEQTMARALRAGACGFLPKDVSKGLFREALEQVATIGQYINEELVERGLPTTSEQYEAQRQAILADLKDRDIDFIRHVCDEREPTYDMVANLMGVSVSAIHGYRERIFVKHGIKSKSGLVIFAYKWGILGRGWRKRHP
ncbi:MAG: response regulator transcription factor [Flavobacteriales bacterium]|jgi:DNA-binding NarL/FixJ family response regulator|nr:response regulator transcription factor [Flavobacteriales bacterium]